MITYRIATESDYQNINDFFNRIYSASRTMEEFYWEFHNGPFGKSIYVIAEEVHKIVGTNCVIPILVTNGEGIIYKTGKSEDTLVDPTYRGKRIFANIYNFLIEACREEGIKVIWGFTSAKKSFERIDFSVPFNGKKSLAIKNILAAYKILKGNKKTSNKDKLKIIGMCVLGKLKTMFAGKGRISKYYKIVTLPITDNVDNLIQNNLAASKTLFAIKQSTNFQSWRLYNNPNYFKVHTYGVYDNNDRLLALIVLNSNKDNSANICQASFDFQLLDDNNAVQILKYVTNDLFKKGIVLIRDFVFNTNSLNEREFHNLRKAGFKHFKKGNGFVWREIGEFEMNPNDFYLSRMATQGVN